jgi:hypothetical protein
VEVMAASGSHRPAGAEQMVGIGAEEQEKV